MTAADIAVLAAIVAVPVIIRLISRRRISGRRSPRHNGLFGGNGCGGCTGCSGCNGCNGCGGLREQRK